MKRNIILVTDGDILAKKAVERAAMNIGGRCISRSAGNPTPISGEEIVKLIGEALYDPVVVMVDDIGNPGQGKGEDALAHILSHPDVKVLGVIAVASNTENVTGIKVDFSIDHTGKVVEDAVDKNGYETDSKILYGDTVDVLNSFFVPLIIGIGDIGKISGVDNHTKGAPLITKALKEIMNRNNKDQ